jgi:hypothetical protein
MQYTVVSFLRYHQIACEFYDSESLIRIQNRNVSTRMSSNGALAPPGPPPKKAPGLSPKERPPIKAIHACPHSKALPPGPPGPPKKAPGPPPKQPSGPPSKAPGPPAKTPPTNAPEVSKAPPPPPKPDLAKAPPPPPAKPPKDSSPRGTKRATPNTEGEENLILPFQLQTGAHCERNLKSALKNNVRHVVIRDFAKVATALKKPVHGLDRCLHTVVTLFDGNPMAAEHCAKNFHVHLLEFLRTQQAENETDIKEKFANDIDPVKLKKMLSRLFSSDPQDLFSEALVYALTKLDENVTSSMPGLDGCGGVCAILIDQLLLIAFFGEKEHSPHAVYIKNDLDKEAQVEADGGLPELDLNKNNRMFYSFNDNEKQKETEAEKLKQKIANLDPRELVEPKVSMQYARSSRNLGKPNPKG